MKNRQTQAPIPRRVELAGKIRKLYDHWLIRLPWPNIDPTAVSLLSVMAALGFVYFHMHDYYWIAVIMLILNMLFDVIDGVIARKYFRTSRKGWIIDTLTDRMSELIIVSVFFTPWFYFWIVNVVLSFRSYVTNKSFILYLRVFFLIYYLFFV